jgi:hypothetical protein
MPYADVSGADSGRAIVVSAASGVQLANWYGGPGDHFGRSVEGVDINSDGEPDIVIGAPEAPSGAGQAFVRLLRAPAPSSYCTAKTNSLGCVAAIQYLGTASLSVVDNFHVYGVNIFNQKNGLLFWGLAPTASPFHGGTLCVQQPIRRTALQSSGGASGPHDCTGQFDFFFSHAYMQSQGIPAGSIERAQYWYRDPGFASPNNFAMTNGLAITIAP